MTSNKDIAKTYFERFNTNDSSRVEPLLGDDLQWTIMGSADAAGTYSKDELLKMMGSAFASKAFKVQMHDVEVPAAEDDRVTVRSTARATLESGDVVNSFYFYDFLITNGQIRKAWVYACK